MMEVVDSVSDSKSANQTERYWIEWFGSALPLLNGVAVIPASECEKCSRQYQAASNGLRKLEQALVGIDYEKLRIDLEGKRTTTPVES